MFKISVRPQWQLESRDGGQQLPRLVELLASIHETGTLAMACRQTGLSYRYAWGLLRQGGQLFGAPLVKMSRGHGAELTALAEKLMWADKRISARLTPLLDSLASELEVELERAVSAVQPILRLQASHGYAVETLRRWFTQAQIPLDLKYRTSFESVVALKQHSCDMAGFSVPTGEFERPMLTRYAAGLQPRSQRLIRLATRCQGLIVGRDNPQRVQSLTDLSRGKLRFVNRQAGSATRTLFDLMIDKLKVDRRRITGYDSAEFTHAAVAAYVASGMADVGFGMQTAAKGFDLGFVPLVKEHYFFVCHTEFLQCELMQRVLETLRSEAFRAAVAGNVGYDPTNAGEVLTVAEAFPEAKDLFA